MNAALPARQDGSRRSRTDLHAVETATRGVGGGKVHGGIVRRLQPRSNRLPAREIAGDVDLIQPVGGHGPFDLNELVALDGFAGKVEQRRCVGGIGAGDKLGVIAHAIMVGVGGLRAVGGHFSEILHLPGVGDAVLIGVNERVVAVESECAADAERVGLATGRDVIRHVAELHDVLPGGLVGDGDGGCDVRFHRHEAKTRDR